MSLASDNDESIRFTLTWNQYACFKKPKGCCGQDCEGCCYTPRFTQGAKVIDATILNQIRFIRPQFSPALAFQERVDPNLQVKVCELLREKKGTKELFNSFFGTNVH